MMKYLAHLSYETETHLSRLFLKCEYVKMITGYQSKNENRHS